jgi:hypothetical protein
MALSVIERPQGVGLGSAVSATIAEDYAAYATIHSVSHGLSDGDRVYISSDIEDYNGFWIVDVIDGHHFFLLQYTGGPNVAFVQDANITYYPESFLHGWSAIHNPIVYKLLSTRFPTNGIDTSRTITNIQNNNGYAKLTLSGSLGTFTELAFVSIDGEVYQIIDKHSTSVITIDLAYSGSLSLSTAILYYPNYAVSVRVYAGLNSIHPWADKKPYELAATLKIIPDVNNKVTFSISQILNSYVELKNNLLLGTLPNNLDAWCMFYITFSETYDTTDGYTITTHEDSYTVDSFEGYAVNAQLEFKNQFSGQLTQYVMNRITAKFLTLFAIPVLFSCVDDNNYQDVSFILEKPRYIDTDQSAKVAGFQNTNAGFDDWNLNTGVVSFVTNGVSRTEVMYIPFDRAAGNYSFEYAVSLSGTWVAGGNVRIGIVGLNANKDIITSTTVLATGSSGSTVSASGVATFSPIAAIKYVGIVVDVVGIKTSGTPSGTVSKFKFVGLAFSLKKEFKNNNMIQLTSYDQIPDFREGVYRMPVVAQDYDTVDLTILEHGAAVSETLSCRIDSDCNNQKILLSWMNNLGGFDSWLFTGQSEFIKQISATGQTSTNLFNNWPKSGGEFADTDKRRQTYRDSFEQQVIASQHVTLDELTAIEYIRSSSLIQIITSRRDRLTVIVDSDSFTSHKDGDKLYSLSFTISKTNNIPGQRA